LVSDFEPGNSSVTSNPRSSGAIARSVMTLFSQTICGAPLIRAASLNGIRSSG
jgi:hypothetical protein